MREQSIHQLIRARAERFPDRVAISAPGRNPMTYRRLASQVSEVVARLNAMGMGRNDRIALVLPNGPEMAAAFLAVSAGATCAPLNPSYRTSEFDFYLSDLNARALVTLSGVDSPARQVARQRGLAVLELSPSLDEEAGRFTLAGPDPAPEGQPDFSLPADVALLLHTSGTTSRPKIVPLSHANICTSAQNICTTLQLSAQDRCLNVMPLFHIHGLIGALLASMVAGADVVCTPGFYAPEFFGWLEAFRPTWYTAVPTMHQAIIARAPQNRESIAQCPLRFIRSSSAPLPPQVLEALESVFQTPVIESYGMTEAAHQMASNPLPPRERKPGSVGVAAGPEIAVMAEDGRILPPGETGEIVIRGANVIDGYESNPQANQTAFASGWFKTGDLGRLDEDGYLFVTGRLKEIINRGGEKISPREVDEALLEHPAIAQAVTFALPDPRLGEDVAAAVVLAERTSATEAEIRDFASRHLADFKVPRRVLILEEIPKGPTGKPQRIGLAERLGLTSPVEKERQLTIEFTAPRTQEEKQVAAIWAQILRLDRVGIHDTFFELGGDSILATGISSRVREAFGVELPPHRLFEAPTVAELSELITQSRAERVATSTDAVNGAAIRRRETADRCALSFAQQRLWFLAQLEPDSPVYNIPVVLRLQGRLDCEALERSLSEVVRRHESLRTTFPTVNGQPMQRIEPPRPFSLPVIDLTQVRAPRREEETQRLIDEEARRIFDLAGGPLYRAVLVRMGETEHLLLLTMHHIISDGWSRGALYEELGALYGAFTAGLPSPLAELPIQYADYAHWQRDWLQGERLETQLAYWKQQLAGAPTRLELPTDYPRRAVDRHSGGRESLVLPHAVTHALRELGQEEGATLFMTLLAAFQILLHRYTGQEDLLVGTPIAGRNRAEIEGIIGFFVNTLVLRTDLSGDPSFRELLGRVRRVALEALAHQDLPFEKLVEELQPQRSLSHGPLCQVMINMLDARASRVALPGLRAEVLPPPDVGSSLDLTLYGREEEDGVRLTLAYNTDLFASPRMVEMLAQLSRLLNQIVANPDERIGQYSLVTSSAEALLPDPSAPLSEPSFELVTESFRSWACDTPERPAVCQGERVWTYEDLNERAQAIARALLTDGLDPGAIVAVTGPRSFGLVASMLGTLMSGGVLFPVDSDLPVERQQCMLHEARPQYLICVGNERSTDEWMPAIPWRGVFRVDSEEGDLHHPESRNPVAAIPLPELHPDDPAYLFFTSGTTGIPKGILGCHKGLAHFLHWQRETFSVGPQDRCAQLTSLSFDAVLRDIFLPLTSGARLHLPEVEEVSDPRQLLQWLEREAITLVHVVPARAQSWLADVPPGITLSALRRLFFAGEPLTDVLVRRWRERFPSTGSIVNLYGPTETTFVKCSHVIPEEVPPGIQSIGRPLPQCQALILAPQGRLCGIGEIGQIVLRTPFRTLGYLNATAEAQQRFVKNPWREEDDDLLYYTGDLGWYRPDGTLGICGRIDDQVKIRGERVEPGEVSAVLARHPEVSGCVVVGRKDADDQAFLVAYVVPAKPGCVTPGALRSYLSEQLPPAMLPSAFVLLDELPLMPNGKVDRRALPEPDLTKREGTAVFVAPRTVLEEALAILWAEVLGPKAIGIHDDFFEMGGHSLRAAQVIGRVRDCFEVEMPLRTLFEAPTIAQMAEVLLQNSDERASTEEAAQLLVELADMPEEEIDAMLTGAPGPSFEASVEGVG